MKRYVLKIDCQDSKGLIYRICNVILNHNLNIDTNQEFVDKEIKKFFFRAIIDADSKIDEDLFISQLKEQLPTKANIYFQERRKKDLVVLATKETHCLGDLLIKFDSKEIDANIKCVISNHEDLKKLVNRFNIPYYFVDSLGKNRQEHEDMICDILKKYKFDCLILAKYMRILSENFVKKFENSIINIHHSFLPAFIGANPYKQAYLRGVKIIGATAHFVNNNLDEGPIIVQDTTTVNHEMGWEDMRRKGRYIEKNVLSHAIDLFCDDRIFIYNNKTVVF